MEESAFCSRNYTLGTAGQKSKQFAKGEGSRRASPCAEQPNWQGPRVPCSTAYPGAIREPESYTQWQSKSPVPQSFISTEAKQILMCLHTHLWPYVRTSGCPFMMISPFLPIHLFMKLQGCGEKNKRREELVHEDRTLHPPGQLGVSSTCSRFL